MNRTMNTSADVVWLVNFDIPMNIQPISLRQLIFRMSTVSVAILLNLIVFVVIVLSRSLRYPRHIFWAGVSLVNQFYVIQYIIEVVAIVHQDPTACQLFSLNAGVGYTILLVFLTLAALDRYLAIAHYQWYQKHVTNRRVVGLLSVSAAVTSLSVTSPFWSGFKSILRCTINLTHVHVVMAVDLLMGILCVLLHAKIFIHSKKLFRYLPTRPQRPFTVRFNGKSSPEGEKNGVQVADNKGFHREENSPDNPEENSPEMEDQITQHPLDQTNNIHVEEYLPCFPIRSEINRLEIRAAFTMSVNVLPFWICTFPVTCNAIALWWCITYGMDCSTVFFINPYLRDLFLIHSVYNPLMYMLTSYEFRRAIQRLRRRSG